MADHTSEGFDDDPRNASTGVRLAVAAGILFLLIALAAWVVFGFLGTSPQPQQSVTVLQQGPATGPVPPPSPVQSALPQIPLPPGMTRIFDGSTLAGWISVPPVTATLRPWTVRDGALASNGLRRGVLYTQSDFANYRIIFDVRHLSGKPDHPPCVLIFCTRPPPGRAGPDALAGVQFQPSGGHWDYRPGHNNGGRNFFTLVHRPRLDVHQWSRVEILVDALRGTARMAVAQPVGSKAVEVLDFHDPSGGKVGPFAIQMHNPGLHDEYANIAVEVNPAVNDLITTK